MGLPASEPNIASSASASASAVDTPLDAHRLRRLRLHRPAAHTASRFTAATHIRLTCKGDEGVAHYIATHGQQSTSERRFKIRKDRPLKMLMHAYWRHFSLHDDEDPAYWLNFGLLRFMVDGKHIDPENTAEPIGLEDGAVLLAVSAGALSRGLSCPMLKRSRRDDHR